MIVTACARSDAGARIHANVPMPLKLRDSVHWCDCDGRALFLDLEQDRYFCLPAAANQAFLRLAAGKVQPGDIEELRILAERGILVTAATEAPIRPPPSIAAPTCDFLADSPIRARPLHLWRALAAEVRVSRLLRSKPFHKVIEAASREGPGKSRPPAAPHNALRAMVAASDAAGILTRVHNRCLVRALALHSLCKRKGIGAKLVFGVIAHPFAAHCWVQLGSAVLVGGFEQARLYTPILVLQ